MNIRNQFIDIQNDINNLCDPVKLVESCVNRIYEKETSNECSVAGVACLATGGNPNPTINPYIHDIDIDEDKDSFFLDEY
jgi:hypothetical protein